MLLCQRKNMFLCYYVLEKICSYVIMSKTPSADGALYVCYYVLRLIPENTCVYCGKRGVFTFTISPRSFEKRGKTKIILQQKRKC